jgi:hypothetical protein
MTILKFKAGFFDEGAYSFVFFDLEGNAVKIFKNRDDAPRKHVESVFLSEVEAYRIATSNELLKNYVPEFYGPVKCDGVLDAAGHDISASFHLDLAYKMRRINGRFEKTGLTDNELRSSFHTAGIRHTVDASVLYIDAQVKCLIDFAVEEHELL